MITGATFKFLKELTVNNDRNWFDNHKDLHNAAKENVLEYVAEIIAGLSQIDTLISDKLEPKNCVMRIYRDVRFSKDKTPYKTNFGVGISPFGKKFNGPGYYLHISPEASFIAGGCWFPEAGHLKLIRQEIDYNAADLKKVIENTEFKNYFGDLDSEHILKTVPKGYSADHPQISQLKLKSFTVSHQITDQDLQNKNAVKKVVEGFEIMHPFIVFLRNALS